MSESNIYDDSQYTSPEQLAKQLFSKKAADPCSFCILPYSESYDNDVASFQFEILLTIYLEGLMNILDVIKNHHYTHYASDINKKDYEIEYEIYKNITIDDLKFPEPWFRSFGYNINITKYGPDDKREFNNKIKPSSYCRILLMFDPKDRMHFLMKGIKKRYTFILSASYQPTKNLENIYTILDKGNEFYKISFRRCYLTGTIKDKCGF